MGFQPSFQRDWDPPKLFSGAKKYSLGGQINPYYYFYLIAYLFMQSIYAGFGCHNISGGSGSRVVVASSTSRTWSRARRSRSTHD